MTRRVTMKTALSRGCVALLPLALAACVQGPNYAGPPAAAGAGQGLVRAGAAQGLPAQPSLGPWWQALGDASLNALVDETLAKNPTLAQAEAHIREAGAVLAQRNVAGRPSLAPSAVAARASLPPFSDGGARTNLQIYNLGASASWEPDFWGTTLRNRQAASATLGQRQADLADAQVSLSAQVVQAYINLRDAQSRLGLSDALASQQSKALGLMRQRAAAGTATGQDVARLESDLQSTLAQQAPLRAQAQVSLNLLAVLAGTAPGSLDARLGAPAPLPTLPAQVAVGDVAGLIARRPDVRAAERALAASTAQVGAAKAKLLPTISFTGVLGLGGTQVGDVVDPSMLAAAILPQLKWQGLDWGKARASVRQSEAGRDAAAAQYQHAVLAALEDAESSLARFGQARDKAAHLTQAEAAARRSETLAAQRQAAGTASGLDHSAAQTALLQASLARAAANAELASDFVSVNKALGLGWQQ